MHARMSVLLLGMCLGASAVAQEPVENINPRHHPELAQAQQHCRAAYDALTIAQKTNRYDMQGHAGKAKHYLDEAAREIRAAATAANEAIASGKRK